MYRRVLLLTQLHNMGTPHTYLATTSTLMEVFSFIFKKVHYNFVYTQLLLQDKPTGLLEV
jgi:hypothetical protein